MKESNWQHLIGIYWMKKARQHILVSLIEKNIPKLISSAFLKKDVFQQLENSYVGFVTSWIDFACLNNSK